MSTSCRTKPEIVFVLRDYSLRDDRAYQAVRMALSVVLTASPIVLLLDEAVRYAYGDVETSAPIASYYDQVRYLREFRVPVFGALDDAQRLRLGASVGEEARLLDSASVAKLLAASAMIFHF